VAAREALTRLAGALTALAAALDELQQRWALVGGLAVSALTEPRFTRDIDLAVAVRRDAEAESLVHALGRRGYRTLVTVEQEAAARLATVRLVCPSEPGEASLFGDLLFASSGIEGELIDAAEPLEVLPGVRVPVAQAGHLLVLKVLSHSPRRPQDLADIQALVKVAHAGELARARAAARLVMERGFHRGRDVPRSLEAFVAGAAE
jgi:hypothetical protein